MLKILSIAVLLCLCYSCTTDKKNVGPANAEFPVEANKVNSAAHPAVAETFQHAYFEKADSLRNQRAYKEAVPLYQEAAKKFESEENWEGMVKAVNEIGNLYYLTFKEDKAIELLKDNMESVKNQLGPNHPFLSDTHLYLGKCYNVSHEPRLSLYHLELCLEIRAKVYGEESTRTAEVYKELGSLYLRRIRDFNLAERFLKKAAAILEGEQDSERDLSSVFRMLASTYRETGDFQKALEYYNTVLSTYNLNSTGTSRSYLNTRADLANVYIEMERYDTAKKLYKSVIDTTLLNFGSDDLALGGYYGNLGSIYTWELENKSKNQSTRKAFYDSANFLFQKSKKIALSINNPKLLSASYFKLGWNHGKFYQSDSALYYLNLCEHLQITPKEFIYREIGNVFLELDSCEKALSFYQKSLNLILDNFSEKNIYKNPALSSKLSNRAIYEILFRKGPAFNKLYDKTKNERDLKAALDTYLLMDKINDFRRNSAFQEESKLFLIDYHQKKFEGGLKAAHQLYSLTKDTVYLESAFHIMEKSKYMLLFKALWEADYSGEIGVPEQLQTEETRIKMELASLRKKLTLHQGALDPNLEDTHNLQQKIFDLINQQDQLRNEIQQKYANYYKIKYDSILVKLPQAQERLDGTNQVINYYWGDTTIFIVGINSEDIKFHSLSIDSELFETLEAFQQLTSSKPELSSKADEKIRFDSLQLVSNRLFKELLAPILSENKKRKSKLIIIPDGPLAQLPFDALLTSIIDVAEVDYRKLSYLKKSYSVSYGYSTNLMLRDQNKNDRNQPGNEILAFGYSSDQSTDGSLPGSAKEIEALQATMRGEFYIGPNASKTTFKANASKFDILHLAVHGTADLESALNSKLIFPDQPEIDTSSHLYAYELYDLNLSNTRLAVLSGCETGIGKQYKGEGTFSIARGFAYAGVPSLVMSLWKVDDAASSILMEAFYQGLKQGMTIDQSLDQAKEQYLDQADPYRAHPAYWAAFIPLGDMNCPIKDYYFERSTKTLLVGLLSLTIVIMLSVVYIKRKQKTAG